MKKRLLILVAILFGLALPLSTFAQGQEDTGMTSDTGMQDGQNGQQGTDTMGGMDGSDGMDTMDQQKMDSLQGLFDPNAVETIQGTVMAIDTSDSVPGYNLKVMTQDQETLMVNLGPKQFIAQQQMTLDSGSQVTVRGSRIQYKGKPLVLAQEVRTDSQTMKLRDENGNPLWEQQNNRGGGMTQ